MQFDQINADYEPPPVSLGAMWSNDQDGAWLVDATANMQRRETTIASIGTVLVVRIDGQTLTVADPTVSGATPQNNGQQFSFSVHTNGNAGRYRLGFPLNLANGDQITRWFLLPVLAYIG